MEHACGLKLHRTLRSPHAAITYSCTIESPQNLLQRVSHATSQRWTTARGYLAVTSLESDLAKHTSTQTLKYQKLAKNGASADNGKACDCPLTCSTARLASGLHESILSTLACLSQAQQPDLAKANIERLTGRLKNSRSVFFLPECKLRFLSSRLRQASRKDLIFLHVLRVSFSFLSADQRLRLLSCQRCFVMKLVGWQLPTQPPSWKMRDLRGSMHFTWAGCGQVLGSVLGKASGLQRRGQSVSAQPVRRVTGVCSCIWKPLVLPTGCCVVDEAALCIRSLAEKESAEKRLTFAFGFVTCIQRCQHAVCVKVLCQHHVHPASRGKLRELCQRSKIYVMRAWAGCSEHFGKRRWNTEECRAPDSRSLSREQSWTKPIAGRRVGG